MVWLRGDGPAIDGNGDRVVLTNQFVHAGAPVIPSGAAGVTALISCLLSAPTRLGVRESRDNAVLPTEPSTSMRSLIPARHNPVPFYVG